MKKERRGWIISAAIVCIVTCFADYIITFMLAEKYPGYNRLTDTLSKLGATASPVGKTISCWWLILSVFFIFFSIGFYQAFRHKGKTAYIATWLIVIYALGEGMGSGLFPADYKEHGLTLSLIIHDTLSGIGVGSIVVLPLVIMQLFRKEKFRFFILLSMIVTVIGLSMLILFSIAKIFNDPDNIILSYKGLWQRLMNANYYLYLIAIAGYMLSHKTGLKPAV
jgi:ABC-type spermidine/putrescine transport system permease subunit II